MSARVQYMWFFFDQRVTSTSKLSISSEILLRLFMFLWFLCCGAHEPGWLQKSVQSGKIWAVRDQKAVVDKAAGSGKHSEPCRIPQKSKLSSSQHRWNHSGAHCLKDRWTEPSHGQNPWTDFTPSPGLVQKALQKALEELVMASFASAQPTWELCGFRSLALLIQWNDIVKPNREHQFCFMCPLYRGLSFDPLVSSNCRYEVPPWSWRRCKRWSQVGTKPQQPCVYARSPFVSIDRLPNPGGNMSPGTRKVHRTHKWHSVSTPTNMSHLVLAQSRISRKLPSWPEDSKPLLYKLLTFFGT